MTMYKVVFVLGWLACGGNRWQSQDFLLQDGPSAEELAREGEQASAISNLLMAALDPEAAFAPSAPGARPPAVATGHQNRALLSTRGRDDFRSVDRRAMLGTAAAALATLGLGPEAALASGGSTAGKYTTEPAAKRKFYGRTIQGVYEFLRMGPAIKAGNLEDDAIKFFFDPIYLGYTEGAAIKIRACKKKAPEKVDACIKKIKRNYESRFDDLRTAMFGLGDGFRKDANQNSENIVQVRDFYSYERNTLRLKKALEEKDGRTAIVAYSAAVDALNLFLDEVDLPPAYFDMYQEPADMRVPVVCQGAFCV